MGWQARRAAPAETGRILKVTPSGGWKAARTRTLESVRYVAQPFQAAGWRSFSAPQRGRVWGGSCGCSIEMQPPSSDGGSSLAILLGGMSTDFFQLNKIFY